MGTAFGIRILERDRTLVVEVEGELDLATAPLLEEKLNEVESGGAPRVLLDLDRVEFMDSSGLHVLLRHVLWSEDGTRYAVTRGSAQVQRLFRASGVIDRLPYAAPPEA
jgi:anti-sigma B factor antagonist